MIFLLLYFVGVCIGCVREIGVENQGEMYEYLEASVTDYNVTASDSIKSIFKDNMKIFCFLFLGGLFLPGSVLLGGVMLVKGYTAGFAITAMLRLFGMKGLIFCGANLVSAAILVPALSWYSGASFENLIRKREDRNTFLKKYTVMLLCIFLILIFDAILRGFLSSMLMKLAGKG